MGFAKYYEDNISICVGRMVVRESTSAVDYRPIKESWTVTAKVAADSKSTVKTDEQHKDNGRRGLEISFKESPNKTVCRKLQLNGWWWSPVKKCWCNVNTNANRKYAEETSSKYQVEITAVGA